LRHLGPLRAEPPRALARSDACLRIAGDDLDPAEPVPRIWHARIQLHGSVRGVESVLQVAAEEVGPCLRHLGAGVSRVNRDRLARDCQRRIDFLIGCVSAASADLPQKRQRESPQRRRELRIERDRSLEQPARLSEVLAPQSVEGLQAQLVEAPRLEVVGAALPRALRLGTIEAPTSDAAMVALISSWSANKS